MTSFSLIVPTQGRATLTRCIESAVAAGLTGADELIVVADVHKDPLAVRRDVLKQLCEVDGKVVYREHDAGHGCWGHCPLNHGLAIALGDYVILNDDDDIWTGDALTRIRAHIAELEAPQPLLFRFQSWWGPVYWDTPGIASEGHIGGHCAVFPNDERLGRFTCRYQGDFDYIRSTLDNWGGDDQAVWVDDVIAIARPAVVRRDEVMA